MHPEEHWLEEGCIIPSDLFNREACQSEERGVAHSVSGMSSLRRMLYGLLTGKVLASTKAALPNACFRLAIPSTAPTEITHLTGAASIMLSACEAPGLLAHKWH